MKNLKKIAAGVLIGSMLLSTAVFATSDVSIGERQGQGRGGFNLDEDTQAVVEEMKEDGATREEIMEYLESEGYEMDKSDMERKSGLNDGGEKRSKMGQGRGERPTE